MTLPWMKCCLVVFLLLCFQTLPVNGDIYSWTDEKGVRHFSNEPPPSGEATGRQKEIKYDADQYKAWDEGRQSRQAKILEAGQAEPKGAKKPPTKKKIATSHPGKVTMYVTPTCGYCKRASSFFKKYDIAFTEYDITTDKQAARRFRELKGSGVPLILVGDRRISGFNKRMLRKLFGIGPAKAGS